MSYPAASNIAPDLTSATAFLDVDLSNRWRTWNSAQLTPDNWERGAWEIATLVDAVFQKPETLSLVIERLRAVEQIAQRPQPEYPEGRKAGLAPAAEQLAYCQELLETSAEFHRQQANWFVNQSEKLRLIRDAAQSPKNPSP